MRPATTHNAQEVPTCRIHKEKELEDIKCICGALLDRDVGAYGPYFSCVNCGNLSFKKGLEMRKPVVNAAEKLEKKQNVVEMTVRSDDPRFFE